MLESQITLTDLANALELVAEDCPRLGEDLILHIGRYFVKIRKPDALFDMWRREKLTWFKFVHSKTRSTEDQIRDDFLVPNVSRGRPCGGLRFT